MVCLTPQAGRVSASLAACWPSSELCTTIESIPGVPGASGRLVTPELGTAAACLAKLAAAKGDWKDGLLSQMVQIGLLYSYSYSYHFVFAEDSYSPTLPYPPQHTVHALPHA